MNSAYHYVISHPAMLSALSVACYHVLNAAIDSLDMPNTSSSAFYRWFFKFSNQLAANYNRAKASDGPAGNKPPNP